MAIDDAAGEGDSAEPAAAVQELARCLRPLVDQLSANYRSAVTLVDLDGLTHPAAARVAGISTSGMKSRVQRGRKQLAALLQDCCTIKTTSTGAIAAMRTGAGTATADKPPGRPLAAHYTGASKEST